MNSRPNSNEYLTKPANIYIQNFKPPKNTILTDLKINKNHMFEYITCSTNVTGSKSLSHKTKQKVYVIYKLCFNPLVKHFETQRSGRHFVNNHTLSTTE